MSFVLDNSVALAWCFEDEQTPPIMALLDRVVETGAMAPLLWPLVLLVMVILLLLTAVAPLRRSAPLIHSGLCGVPRTHAACTSQQGHW